MVQTDRKHAEGMIIDRAFFTLRARLAYFITYANEVAYIPEYDRMQEAFWSPSKDNVL